MAQPSQIRTSSLASEPKRLGVEQALEAHAGVGHGLRPALAAIDDADLLPGLPCNNANEKLPGLILAI